MQHFFDTSALVKLYHQEEGSKTVATLFRSKQPVIISELSKVEFLSTVSKKYRMREINGKTYTALKNRFLSDCLDHFIVIPMVSSIIEMAVDLIDQQGKSHHLFSLDALQIATFILASEGEVKFVCADKRLSLLVKKIGYSVIDV
jgi:uncharacterized protein